MRTRRFVMSAIIAITSAAIIVPSALAATWYTSMAMQTSSSGSSRHTWTAAGTGVDAGGSVVSYTAVKPKIAKSGVGSQSRTKVCNLAARCDESSPYYSGAGTYQSTASHWYQISGQNRVDLPGSSSPWVTLN